MYGSRTLQILLNERGNREEQEEMKRRESGTDGFCLWREQLPSTEERRTEMGPVFKKM